LKKIIVFTLILTLAISLFAGCGASPEPATSPAPAQSPQTAPEQETETAPESEPETEEIDDSRIDAGNVSAVCPDGWDSFPWEGEDGSNNLKFYKGIQPGTQDDIDRQKQSVPAIAINYKTGDGLFSFKDFYDDAEDWGPQTIGEYTWEGFTATWNDDKVAILTSGDLTLNIWLEMADGASISLDDQDVRDIIASIRY